MKILILARATDGKANKMTAELMGLGCRLNDTVRGEIHAVLLGPEGSEEAAAELIALGAQTVHLFPHEVLGRLSGGPLCPGSGQPDPGDRAGCGAFRT